MSIVNWTTRAALVAAFGVLATGCVVVEERRRPPPAQVEYVEPAPPPAQPIVVQEAPPPAEQVVVVHQRPPADRMEVRPAMPGPGFVWITGYWVDHRNQWVWVSGRWDRPPHPGAHWEPHRWVEGAGGFHLVVGGWR